MAEAYSGHNTHKHERTDDAPVWKLERSPDGPTYRPDGYKGPLSHLPVFAAATTPSDTTWTFFDMTGPPKQRMRRERTLAEDSNAYCFCCGATETPEWRSGPAGRKTLCNACGLQYAKHLREAERSAGEGHEKLLGRMLGADALKRRRIPEGFVHEGGGKKRAAASPPTKNSANVGLLPTKDGCTYRNHDEPSPVEDEAEMPDDEGETQNW